MNIVAPRMRMFAGPNGSGKSVLKSYLPLPLLGVYLNPDEIEIGIKKNGFVDLGLFQVATTADEVLSTFSHSTLLAAEGLQTQAARMRLIDGRLDFAEIEVNSYFASVIVDFVRHKLLEKQTTFTFETVMSHPGKMELLDEAQQTGYRTYLYYVATDDPAINVSRVANRVGLGGHPVPEDKIIGRYYRSLELLIDAIKHANRAYIFDNSTDSTNHKLAWLAEITDGRTLELKTDQIPHWFKKYVLDRI